VQQPLAYFLSSDRFDLGQYGVAWAVSIALVSRLLFYVPYFYWGRWMRVRMFDSGRGGPPPDRVATEGPPPATPEPVAAGRLDA
jgi:hypothetical protein